jgi:hypothetical protein
MIYVQTRSAKVDYEFFGETPKEHWWASSYAPFFEDGAFNVFADIRVDGWSAYLGGVESTRKDRTDTPVRYAFAGKGTRDDDFSAQFFYDLLWFLLSPYQNDESLRKCARDLGVYLDGEEFFSAGFIDSLDETRHTDDTDRRVQDKLREFKRRHLVQHPQDNQSAPNLKNNAAYLTSKRSVKQFLYAAEALLTNKKPPVCLVITSLPLEKNTVTAWAKDQKKEALLFLSSYPDEKAKSNPDGRLFELKLTPAAPPEILEDKLPFNAKEPPNQNVKKVFAVGAAIVALIGVVIFLIKNCGITKTG